MATRSTITFKLIDTEDKTTQTEVFYHHYDGYLTGVGYELVRFIEEHHEKVVKSNMLSNLTRELSQKYELPKTADGKTYKFGNEEYQYIVTITKGTKAESMFEKTGTIEIVAKHDYNFTNDQYEKDTTIYKADIIGDIGIATRLVYLYD